MFSNYSECVNPFRAYEHGSAYIHLVLSGIYIHIPFCKKACHYCDFHFSTSLQSKEQLLSALVKELNIRSNEIGDTIETIYFGGGTPSLLSKNELHQLLSTIKSLFSVAHDAEITLEANPDDLSLHKLNDLKTVGINRLSIGIQSFRPQDLTLMNRAHSSSEAMQCVESAKKVGFNNISIDLIYGSPDLGIEAWEENLKIATELDIQHISAYCLTIENKTVFSKWEKTKKITLPDDEETLNQFIRMKDYFQNCGFEHYEISNFGRSGFYSKHNSSYWFQKHYLGIGPSAHSFQGNTRSWNVSNNAKYIKAIEEGHGFSSMESLSAKDQFNEHLMTRIRTKWGASIEELIRIDNFLYEELRTNTIKWVNDGLLIDNGFNLMLSQEGLFVADTIISDLFIV